MRETAQRASQPIFTPAQAKPDCECAAKRKKPAQLPARHPGHDFGRMRLRAAQQPAAIGPFRMPAQQPSAVRDDENANRFQLPDEIKFASRRQDFGLKRPQEFIHGTPAVIDGSASSILCKGGGLTVQNINTGPDKGCSQKHEQSHIADWQSRYGPDLCKGVADGSLPVGGAGYDEFLRLSECKAYKIGKPCRVAMLGTASAADKPAIQAGIDRDNAQLASHGCG